MSNNIFMSNSCFHIINSYLNKIITRSLLSLTYSGIFCSGIVKGHVLGFVQKVYEYRGLKIINKHSQFLWLKFLIC